MSIRKIFYNIYGSIEKFITPGLVFSQVSYEYALKKNVKKDSLWLDIGCGHNILPFWRRKEEEQISKIPALIVGLDADLPSLLQHKNINYKIKGDISCLPFKNASFNLVTANMVFEHLKDPEKQLLEIHRILKPGGILIFHTPNAGGYATILARLIPESFKKKLIYFLQNRKEEDVFPTFYRINALKTIKNLAVESGFDVKEILFVPSTALFIMIPPLVLFELLWIRLTMFECFKFLRTNIIVSLVKTY